jgi:hypothetical protein
MRAVDKPQVFAALLGACLLVSTTSVSAACKYNVDTIHSRTGEKVLWTKWNTFTLVQKGDFAVGSGVSIGDRKYFALRFGGPGARTKAEVESAFVIPEGGKVLIKLDDDSILELLTDEPFIAEARPNSSEMVVRYQLDAASLDALLTKRILNIRIETNIGDVDFAYGKKGAKKMQKVLKCIE